MADLVFFSFGKISIHFQGKFTIFKRIGGEGSSISLAIPSKKHTKTEQPPKLIRRRQKGPHAGSAKEIKKHG